MSWGGWAGEEEHKCSHAGWLFVVDVGVVDVTEYCSSTLDALLIHCWQFETTLRQCPQPLRQAMVAAGAATCLSAVVSSGCSAWRDLCYSG
jgi:hypothetical protein